MSERLFFTAAAAFQSARRIDRLPQGHRASRLHGHGFLARVRADLPPSWTLPGDEVSRLRVQLEGCVEPLDYRLLNEQVEAPTDENLARWVKVRLDVPGVEQIGLASTPCQGVDLGRNDRCHLWRRYRFEAAHRLPNVAPGHKCGRMHGHGFEVVLHAEPGAARVSRIDAEELDRRWAPLGAELHHACLNDIAGLGNPTSEMIASMIWGRLKPSLPELSWVTVHETATCGAHFDGERYRIWTELSLDSALTLKRVAPADPRRRVHGHTYGLRLHLSAPLDQVLGWTVDFGDVKQIFSPVFLELDHQPLYEMAGSQDNDVASLVRWIKAQAAPALPALSRIDLFETPDCGAILAWGEGEPALAV